MAQEFINKYTSLDRLLHRTAFSSGGVQVSLADLEDKIYSNQLAEQPNEKPVFISALPRAGTTILLNLLHQTGGFVSHTYKSMPFVLCPMFWRRFSKSLGTRERQEMQRAHGDGITISLDSPEAFEEMIWSHFWQAHYLEDRIKPWTRHKHTGFVRFLDSHMRKQLLLAGGKTKRRYVSKNNLNIARLDYIRSIFQDATIVVLFRSPLQHASSLLKQHRNFLQSHKTDKFAKDYMRGIGHYDFGENFLPVNFDNWLADDRRADATELVFWLEYWTAAYRNVLRHLSDSVVLLSFEGLTQQPERTLHKLANSLELEQPRELVEQYRTLHAPALHEVDIAGLPAVLLQEANTVYDALVAHTAVG